MSGLAVNRLLEAFISFEIDSGKKPEVVYAGNRIYTVIQLELEEDFGQNRMGLQRIQICGVPIEKHPLLEKDQWIITRKPPAWLS